MKTKRVQAAIAALFLALLFAQAQAQQAQPIFYPKQVIQQIGRHPVAVGLLGTAGQEKLVALSELGQGVDTGPTCSWPSSTGRRGCSASSQPVFLLPSWLFVHLGSAAGHAAPKGAGDFVRIPGIRCGGWVF